SALLGRSFRNKPSKEVAFPHPQSRKNNYRNGYKPKNRGILGNLFKRSINVTDYGDAEDDVHRSKNQMYGGVIHELLLFGKFFNCQPGSFLACCSHALTCFSPTRNSSSVWKSIAFCPLPAGSFGFRALPPKNRSLTCALNELMAAI